MLQEHGLSLRCACRALRLSRTVYYYQTVPNKDQPVIDALLELVDRFPRYGFGKLFPLIRRQGHSWNHKRVHRIYCALGLNIRRKGKRRLPNRNPDPLRVPESINQCWSADFMSDALWCGRRYRTFNVVDDFNREALMIDIDLNLPAQRVIRALERIAAWRGYPARLRVDNGPELTSVYMAQWAEEHGVELEFIQPGKPTQNSFIERFNRTYREEVLSLYIFKTLSEVRQITESWLEEYNEIRPHESLGNLTPSEYLGDHIQLSASTYAWH
jgi:putative transposase